MDETELITTIQSTLSSALPAPVKTDLEDERPVPVVLIDDWDTRELNHNNSARAGEAYGDFNNDGTKTYEWYLNFSFKTRVEFQVRHSDEVDASQLKSDLKRELRLIRERPQSFHSDLKKCNPLTDGNPGATFVEPREHELVVSARFHGDHCITRTASDVEEDTLEEVKNDFTFNT